MMLIARFVCGIGAGSISVIEANLALASTMKERNKAFAIHACTESLALFIGPGFQAVFVPVGYPGFDNQIIHFNMYTAPIFVISIFTMIYLILLITVYKNFNVVEEKIIEDPLNSNFTELQQPPQELKTFAPAFACVWVRTITIFCLVYDDTLGSIFMMTMFRWTRAETVLYNGIIQFLAGFIDSLGHLFIFKVVLKRIHIRTAILFGILSLLMFYVISYSWPGLPPIITEPSSPDQYNCTYAWCFSTGRVSLWQYLLAYLFFLAAFPTGYSPTKNLLSKIANLDMKRQGWYQGFGNSMEYLATLLGPIIVTAVYQSNGPRLTWEIAAALLVSALVVQIALFKRLGKIEEFVAERHCESIVD